MPMPSPTRPSRQITELSIVCLPSSQALAVRTAACNLVAKATGASRLLIYGTLCGLTTRVPGIGNSSWIGPKCIPAHINDLWGWFMTVGLADLYEGLEEPDQDFIFLRGTVASSLTLEPSTTTSSNGSCQSFMRKVVPAALFVCWSTTLAACTLLGLKVTTCGQCAIFKKGSERHSPCKHLRTL